MIKITYGCGFFSCCSVRLHEIIKYFNANKKTPEIVDSSEQFKLYKHPGKNDDVTYNYFDKRDDYNIDYVNNVDYVHDYQFSPYSGIDYKNICDFVEKYFTPSQNIKTIVKNMEQKYNIDYNNTCVLFYRGNDKITETKLCHYNDMINEAIKIKQQNPNIRFLIQSDETEFIIAMTHKFRNSFYFRDEVRHMRKRVSSVDLHSKHLNHHYSKYYLAVTIIMSKCKYIVCTSGNCSIWILFYRKNSDNVRQFLNGTWM